MSYKNELSNLSYTNKDFNAIYTELLEYAKKLSYKWDPSASDESDPGVVLLKLAALIGDKNSYNIDKNVLELMPASVSQLPAARQLFEQCGYSMKYYRAAVGDITLSVIKQPSVVQSYIDNLNKTSKNVTYKIPPFTMVTDIDSSVVYTFIPTNKLSFVEPGQRFEVMQGTAVEYTINNDPLITLMNLDNKNRLYFTETNIAENGIFITNVGDDANNYEEWQKVDNIEVVPKGSRCYKFGLSLDNSTCYIEFPNDVEYVFGEGINITYIRTDGNSGNIAANKLKQFYVDTKFTVLVDNLIPDDLSDPEVTVTAENISINNPTAIINGTDPESIDTAYKSYKRVKDTFDTLVTLKDYTDYMITAEYASNGYVCDRTNDIQRTHKIASASDMGSSTKIVIEQDIDNIDIMTPYDICIYALNYEPTVDTLAKFRSSFTMTEPDAYEKLLREEQIKSLQHNFLDLESDKILMIKNKYRVNATVIPRNKLDPIQQNELLDNIKKALYKAVNSKELSFGESVSYDLLYETINNADERIKAASVSYPTYETYAVYKSGKGFAELRIDADSKEPSNPQDIESENYLKGLWHKFRTDIQAKNILNGASPLCNKDPNLNFSFGLNQADTTVYENVSAITTKTDIDFTHVDNSNTWKCAPLTDNENILFRVPSYIPEPTHPYYSLNAKVVNNFESSKSANTKYELNEGEVLIVFWKSKDSNEYYDYVRYDSTSNSLANIFSCTFNLAEDNKTYTDIINKCTGTSGTTENIDGVYTIISELKDDSHAIQGTNKLEFFVPNTIAINNTKNGCSNVYWFTKSLNDQNEYLLKWEKIKDTSGNVHVEYTLKSGEYFVYTNTAKTTLHILGEGTTLNRENLDTSSNLEDPAWTPDAWKIKAVSYNDLLLEGIDAIDTWYKLDLDDAKVLVATEYQQVLVGRGTEVTLTYLGSESQDETVTINDSRKDLKHWSISYQSSLGNAISTTLESFANLNNVCWTARSILNLNMSSSKPQKILAHQQVTLKQNKLVDGKLTVTETPITGQNANNKAESKYLLASTDVAYVGGTDIDVRTYNNYTAQREFIKVMSYTFSNKTGETTLKLDAVVSTNNSVADANDVDIRFNYYPDSFNSTVTIRNNNASSEDITTVEDLELPVGSLLTGKYLIHVSTDSTPQKLGIKGDVKHYSSGASGLYDAAGNLTASWEYLESKGLELSIDRYAGETYTDTLEYMLKTDEQLFNSTMLVIDDSVTKIGMLALSDCVNLTTIIIPNSVETISHYAFASCKSLTSIEIPESVKSVGEGAFVNCQSLVSVTSYCKNPSIKPVTFSGCSSLTYIYFKYNINEVKEGALQNCSSLAHIYVGNSVAQWLGADKSDDWNRGTPDNFLVHCSNGVLKNETLCENSTGLSHTTTTSKIEIKGKGTCQDTQLLLGVSSSFQVVDIASQAFQSDTQITSVVIPKLSRAQEYAFADCRSLKTVVIQDNRNTTYIGTGAFMSCHALSYVKLPEKLSNIANMLFADCTHLKCIKLPASITYIGNGAFAHCGSLTRIDLPDSVTQVGSEAFYNCASLKSVLLGTSVKTIEKDAFKACTSLESIVLPTSIQYVGDDAFRGCTSLKRIYISSELDTLDTSKWGIDDSTEIIYRQSDTGVVQKLLPRATNYSYTLNLLDTHAGAYSINLSAAFKGPDLAIYLKPLFKIDKSSEGNLDNAELISRLNILDVDGTFDYTAVENTVIPDPLVPESFHNKKHFYNKYTIDEWTESSDGNKQDIYITTNIR